MSDNPEESQHGSANIPIEPELVLQNLRQFCVNEFGLKAQHKPEIRQNFYSYLGQILIKFCDQFMAQVLKNQGNVVFTESVCYVFGDIHGNVEDIYDYEKLFWNRYEKDANYVFLGDYVDRGEHSIEVCVYLFALKMFLPDQFTLVRGNHEVRDVNKHYTFLKECTEKFGDEYGKVIWDKFNKCFERLPLAAIIDNAVFCCHGGVPRGMVSIDSIKQIRKPLIKPLEESEVANGLIWNDPIESMTTYTAETEQNMKLKNILFVPNKARSIGWYYTAQAVHKFLDFNNLQYMIRAHEAIKTGYKFTSDDRAITVFSASNYCGLKNTTACVRVAEEGIQVVILKAPHRKSKTIKTKTTQEPNTHQKPEQSTSKQL